MSAVKTAVTIVCSKCYKQFTVELHLNAGYNKKAFNCPYCGTLYHITTSVSVKKIDITEKDLDEFEKWLLQEKHLVSAKSYRRIIEKYIETAEIPRNISPINYFNEFMRIKGKNIQIYI